MAARKKKRGLRPRIPSRVKRRKPAKPKRSRAHGHHSELWGLGLVALGLFLAVVLYGGWNGGIVGGPVADAVHGLVGAAAYVVPLALLVVGYSVPRLRVLLAGLAVGVAAHLAFFAVVPMATGLGVLWLAANAVACLGLAHVALRR